MEPSSASARQVQPELTQMKQMIAVAGRSDRDSMNPPASKIQKPEKRRATVPILGAQPGGSTSRRLTSSRTSQQAGGPLSAGATASSLTTFTSDMNSMLPSTRATIVPSQPHEAPPKHVQPPSPMPIQSASHPPSSATPSLSNSQSSTPISTNRLTPLTSVAGNNVNSERSSPVNAHEPSASPSIVRHADRIHAIILRESELASEAERIRAEAAERDLVTLKSIANAMHTEMQELRAKLEMQTNSVNWANSIEAAAVAASAGQDVSGRLESTVPAKSTEHGPTTSQAERAASEPRTASIHVKGEHEPLYLPSMSSSDSVRHPSGPQSAPPTQMQTHFPPPSTPSLPRGLGSTPRHLHPATSVNDRSHASALPAFSMVTANSPPSDSGELMPLRARCADLEREITSLRAQEKRNTDKYRSEVDSLKLRIKLLEGQRSSRLTINTTLGGDSYPMSVGASQSAPNVGPGSSMSPPTSAGARMSSFGTNYTGSINGPRAASAAGPPVLDPAVARALFGQNAWNVPHPRPEHDSQTGTKRQRVG